MGIPVTIKHWHGKHHYILDIPEDDWGIALDIAVQEVLVFMRGGIYLAKNINYSHADALFTFIVQRAFEEGNTSIVIDCNEFIIWLRDEVENGNSVCAEVPSVDTIFSCLDYLSGNYSEMGGGYSEIRFIENIEVLQNIEVEKALQNPKLPKEFVQDVRGWMAMFGPRHYGKNEHTQIGVSIRSHAIIEWFFPVKQIPKEWLVRVEKNHPKESMDLRRL